MDSQEAFQLSIVVPFYNEEDNVRPMYNAILQALGSEYKWQCVFVNDGSSDGTLDELRILAGEDSRVRVIALSRNYGQTPAMVSGIRHSDGEVIVTMDGDLQNDPSDIPTFLDGIKSGFDIVVGWRVNRQDKLISRKIPSWIANRLIGWVTGLRIKDNGCSLKAYRADVIRNIPLYSEMHRFIPAMASMAGSRINEIPVKHHARIHGESKYGISRTFKVLGDLVVVRTLLSSFGRPSRVFRNFGVAGFLASVFLMIASAAEFWLGNEYSVFLAVAALSLIFSAYNFGLGFIALLVSRNSDVTAPSLASLTKTFHGRS